MDEGVSVCRQYRVVESVSCCRICAVVFGEEGRLGGVLRGDPLLSPGAGAMKKRGFRPHAASFQ